ncbi:MAG TPA: hypothetical protein VIV56_07315 [Gemmatimonadales bacterium]
MSLRTGLLADALAKLNAVGRPAGVPEAELGLGGEAGAPSILLYWTEDDARAVGTSRRAVDVHELTLLVECRAAEVTALNCYEAVEPFLAWVEAALNGQLLSGAVREVVMGKSEATMVAEAQLHILVTVEFKVAYQHKVGDVSQAA